MKRNALFAVFFLADAALLAALQKMSGQSVSALPLLADCAPVLLFLLPARFLRSAVCAVLSVTAGFLTLLFRGIDLGCFIALKEPLTYPVFRLLAEHTEHASLAAQFGSLYHIALTAVLLLTAAVFALLCVFEAKQVLRKREKTDRPLLVLSVFSLVSLAAAVMQAAKPAEPYSRYPVFRNLAALIREGRADIARKSRPVRPGRFIGRVSPQSLQILAETGIISLAPPDRGFPVKLPVFDRIVVIAVESLDLAYIHAYNPDGIPADATPFLDRLTAKYPSFTNFFTGAQPTSFAFAAMLLSRMDFDDDLRLKSVSLCDLLRSRYKTRYIAPTNGDLFDNARDYKTLFRFDEQFFLKDLRSIFGVRAETRWGLHDRTVFDCASRILEDRPGEKSVTFISTMDMHNPYIGASGPDTPFLNALRATDAN